MHEADDEHNEGHLPMDRATYAHIFLYILVRVCVCLCVLTTDRSHNAREAPLGAEEPVAVQASLLIQIAVQHVHPDHVWVHGVGVLPHSGLDHRLPRVTAHTTAQRNMKGKKHGLSLLVTF